MNNSNFGGQSPSTPLPTTAYVKHLNVNFMIVRRIEDDDMYCYVPLIVRDKAVMFEYESHAITFLQTITGQQTQYFWQESPKEKNPTAYAIRPIRFYDLVDFAVEDFNYPKRQEALHLLTPEQRKLLKLPDPD